MAAVAPSIHVASAPPPQRSQQQSEKLNGTASEGPTSVHAIASPAGSAVFACPTCGEEISHAKNIERHSRCHPDPATVAAFLALQSGSAAKGNGAAASAAAAAAPWRGSSSSMSAPLKPLHQCLTCRAWFFSASTLTRHINLMHGVYAVPAANGNAPRKRKFAETAAAVTAAAPLSAAASLVAAASLHECDLCGKASFASAPTLASHRKDCWNKLIRVTRALRTPLQLAVIEREQRVRVGRAKIHGS